jgi:hypothetical protein
MQSALVEIPRWQARNLDEETVRKLVLEHVEEGSLIFREQL